MNGRLVKEAFRDMRRESFVDSFNRLYEELLPTIGRVMQYMKIENIDEVRNMSDSEFQAAKERILEEYEHQKNVHDNIDYNLLKCLNQLIEG